MDLTVTGFTKPAAWKDLKPGDVFFAYEGDTKFTAIKCVPYVHMDDDKPEEALVILERQGKATLDEPPAFVWRSALPSQELERLSGPFIVAPAKPPHDGAYPEPVEGARNGQLVLSGGEAYVALVSAGEPTLHVNLKTGAYIKGKLNGRNSAYNDWKLSEVRTDGIVKVASIAAKPKQRAAGIMAIADLGAV